MSPDTLPDLFRDGAFALAARLARREFSALELCDALIARIEREDPAINAVVVRDFARARDAARAADAALARGEAATRPLLGVPMTVKEAFDVAGLPTTWGFAQARELPVTQDAEAVRRLKAAGAVIVGKTNVPVALGDWQSANPVYGRTRHPLAPARTPGGSSGGSAAALLAGLTPLELGSDIGGSIRVPAHFCGVFGHKPTHGLLPLRGHAFPGFISAPDPLAVIGPLARSAADLEQAVELLAGADAPASRALRITLPPPRHARLDGYRLLVLDQHPAAVTADAVRAGVDAVAERCARAGATIVRRHEFLPDLAATTAAYIQLLLAITLRGAPPEARPPRLSADDFQRLLDQQYQTQLRWGRVFEDIDAVLAPPFGTLAFAHDDQPIATRRLPVDGRDTAYNDQLAWPGIATWGRLPATVAPTGLMHDGLPGGVQIIGPAWEDRTPLALARWLDGAH